MTRQSNSGVKRGAQRGGFALGAVIGLLIGLALALGVALYVTKAPVPFVNKVPQRTAEQDAAETEKNRNWDPNAPLASKTPARAASLPADSASGAVAAPPASAVLPAVAAPAASRAASAVDKAADKAVDKSARDAPGAFQYFVQVGAYSKPDDAEQQRAKLAITGLSARVTDREQNGRTVYRVRLGPYEAREDADKAREQAAAAGYAEAALVRVAR